MAGTLWHEDGTGAAQLVGPGQLFVQSTGEGLRHREWNASDAESLRFVQITVLAEAEYAIWSADVPTTVAGVRVDVRADEPEPAPTRFALPLPDGHFLVLDLAY